MENWMNEDTSLKAHQRYRLGEEEGQTTLDALTDKEAGEIAALAGYTENYRKVINYHEVMQLKDRLKKIPLLFHYIDSHSKEAYGTAIGYLIQEGLLEPVPYALVDSGWIGTIQQSIEHLLRQKQPDRKL